MAETEAARVGTVAGAEALQLLDQSALEAGPAVARSAAARAALPVADVAAAVLLAAAILRPWPAALAYCAVAVPALAAIDGHAAAPVGGRESVRTLGRLVLAAIAAEWAAFLVAGSSLAPGRALVLLAATVGAWWLVRCARTRLQAVCPERVVILGSGRVAARVAGLVTRHGGRRMEVIGYLDDGPDGGVDGLPRLGGLAHLRGLVATERVDRLLVAFTAGPDERLLETLRRCDDLGVRVDLVPRLFELLPAGTRSYTLGGIPLMAVRRPRARRTSRAVKRALDVAVAGAALVVCSPVLALIALAVRLEDRGPVLFAQERIGRFGRPFSILKFRSMRLDAEAAHGAHLAAARRGEAPIAEVVAMIKPAADTRVTRVGRILRRTSLDELPQLWNVLRGDMSLVGPRPLRDFEVAALRDWQLARQLERPGLTGLWQVTGRSRTSWEERMEMDYSYVRHWSLAEDVEILALTLPVVLSRDGAW